MPLEDVSDRSNKVYDAMKSAGITSEDKMRDAEAIENVEAPEELRPHRASGTPGEGLRETPGTREGRRLLAHQVTRTHHRRGRASAAAIMIGRMAVASPSIVTCFAVSLTLPQEIPSRSRAPLKLPSHSGAVVM